MYIPKSFKVSDAETLYKFLREYNFATLVTEQHGHLTASAIPFMVDSERGVLKAHVARANDQWQHFDGREALVIFQGPHAYISPSWYTEQPSVPTWNYSAVHVYGAPTVISDETVVQAMLTELVANHEHGRDPEWPMQLPDDYYHKMRQAIVVFEIPIARIEGKFKLSQNRSEADVASVIDHLESSSSPLDNETARLMADQRQGS